MTFHFEKDKTGISVLINGCILTRADSLEELGKNMEEAIGLQYEDANTKEIVEAIYKESLDQKEGK